MTDKITDTLKCMMANATLVCGGIMMISIASLAAALTAEHLYGLKPCILCIYQRWPYGIAAALGFIGLVLTYNADWAKRAAFTVFLSGIVFLAGAVIAFYHTGVELHWWKSMLEGCSVDFAEGSAQDILALIESTDAVRCDEIPWADPVIGWSMANWNVVMSAGLSIGCFISSILIARKANGVL